MSEAVESSSVQPENVDFPENTLQAVFVLGGGNRVIEKQGHDPRFTTSPYKGKFFPEKTGGAKARPVAALELARKYPDAKIVTLSKRPGYLAQGGIDQPPFASVMAEDLIRHGIDRARIIEHPAPTSTLSEIMEVIKISAEFDWANVDVVVSDYQKKRGEMLLDMITDPEKYQVLKRQLQSLFTNDSELEIFQEKMIVLEQAIEKNRASGSRINFVSAEDVLIGRNKHYSTLIHKVRGLEGYANTQRQEDEANRNIANGEYNFAQPTFREYIMHLN